MAATGAAGVVTSGADGITLAWCGPDDHGIAIAARRIAEAAGADGTDGHLVGTVYQPDPAELPSIVDRLAPETALVHLHINDWLFGAAADRADHTITTLAKRLARRNILLSLTLHDVPQPADGPDLFRIRCARYASMASHCAGIVLASEHERHLLAAALRMTDTPMPQVRVIPLAVKDFSVGGPLPSYPGPPSAVSTTGSRGLVDDGDRVRSIGIFGYLFPGKGHREVIDELSGLSSRVELVAVGRPSDRHPGLPAELSAAADKAGIGFRTTGWVPDGQLLTTLRGIDVAVAPHTKVSASDSINSWIAARRRPLAAAGRYVDEVETRMPGALWIYQPGTLRESIQLALDHPERTVLPADFRVSPTMSEVGAAYLNFLRSQIAINRA